MQIKTLVFINNTIYIIIHINEFVRKLKSIETLHLRSCLYLSFFIEEVFVLKG